MKIVTYNVNGLRQRISQFGSILKLLDSFDADVICFQETKLRRQELTADIAIADGYESFFSCTRTNDKGRTGYSGVATFCRVKSAFSSTEAALPVAAEEGFTGLVDNARSGKNEMPADGLEEFEKDELLKVDSEGRCIITDHGHFVLFNVYGPRAGGDDTERIQFKLKFYQILQKRWESLFSQGRRVFVVGDLNIAPTAMDRCDAEPDFEKNEFRRWLRSILVTSGGPFFDVFRAKHPDRREAYTCWPSNTGAEQFNFGSRIDHILCSVSCLHQKHDSQGHDFVTCHVEDCDILTEYKRWRPGNTPSWKGGWSTKLEGSDHAPVCMTLLEIPDIPQHGTPALSSRYLPMIHGLQQTLVSMLMKRQATTQLESCMTCSDGNVTVTKCSETCSSILKTNSQNYTSPNKQSNSGDRIGKKARKSQSSQLSLKSFFQKTSTLRNCGRSSSSDIVLNPADVANSNNNSCGSPSQDDRSRVASSEEPNLNRDVQDDQCEVAGSSQEEEKKSVALQEWQRIHQLMQNSIPLCKGHKEPCVARVVKKPGPTFGRRFYVCARAEGPASNPEANCGYFKWAASKSRQN